MDRSHIQHVSDKILMRKKVDLTALLVVYSLQSFYQKYIKHL